MKTKIFAAVLLTASAPSPAAYAGDGDAKVTSLAGGAATGAVLGGRLVRSCWRLV